MPHKNKIEKREYQAKRKLKNLSNGMCSSCGTKPLKTTKYCKECNERQCFWQKERRRKAKAKGLCTVCLKNSSGGMSQCQECRQKHRKYQKTRNSRVAEKGLCIACAKHPPKEGTKLLCVSCAGKRDARRRKLKDRVYSEYGGYVCNCCGETGRKFLTIDHIDNNGSFMRKNVHGSSSLSLLMWLRKNSYPKGFQILCWNCQLGKYHNGGVCPHQEPSVVG